MGESRHMSNGPSTNSVRLTQRNLILPDAAKHGLFEPPSTGNILNQDLMSEGEVVRVSLEDWHEYKTELPQTLTKLKPFKKTCAKQWIKLNPIKGTNSMKATVDKFCRSSTPNLFL